MTDATKLKPCPFCGDMTLVKGKTTETKYLSCEGCGAEMHGCGPKAASHVVRKWNQRSDIAPKVDVIHAAKVLLEAYDGSISGGGANERQKELTKSVSLAASFGAAAYEAGMTGGNDIHALARSFLLALIDPTSEQLDYLRSDPSSGEKTRAALETQGEG